MKITVKNYRGAAEASLTLSPAALICGPNGAGKSSIAQAVAAALTRNAAILPGLTKTAASALLRDGAARGSCEVTTAEGSVKANWPGASVSDKGDMPPSASAIACGLDSLADMKPKEVSALLGQLIGAEPTEADLREYCGDAVTDEVLAQVWQGITERGWDAAHKRARERGTLLKGQWEEITGERWGAKKGDQYTGGVLPGLTVEYAQQAVTDAEREVEQALANQAADGARREMLQQRVNPAAMPDIGALGAKAEAAEKAAAEAREHASSLPRPHHVTGPNAECPHCQGALVVAGGRVTAPDAQPDEAENQRLQAAINDAQAKATEAQNAATRARTELQQGQAAARDIAAARQELEALPDGTVTADEIEALREAVQHEKQKLHGVQARERAAKRHASILQNQKLIEALAPEGVRQAVLTRALGEFNSHAERICAAARWPVVELHPDMSTTYGGRHYALLSASEQFRARTAQQLALAAFDGSDAVIIDAADILDRTGRNGLIRALKVAKVLALVCMTIDSRDAVPDLAKAGIGASYWIEAAALELAA